MNGTLQIRNVSSSEYCLVDLGDYSIPPGQTVDLMGPDLPVYYDDWGLANQLVVSPSSDLYRAIQDGTIQVVVSRPKL
jgi:hypothetical protein